MTDYEIEEGLKKLFLQSFEPDMNVVADSIHIVALPQSGSDRRYYRMSYDNISAIGSYVPDSSEGECFVGLSQVFRSAGISVPEVYSFSKDYKLYLQQDLGGTSLFSLLNTDQELTESLIKQTLKELIRMQKTPESLWSGVCINAQFSKRQVLWDLNYFKYDYLKPNGAYFNENMLENDFEALSDNLIAASNEFSGFMMRDCQSRNVMITDSSPVFIDFQGGRKGPVLYDAVSLLWQARAGFNNDFRNKMLDYYAETYCNGDKKKKNRMLSTVSDIVLFRTLQVLGAYGFRGLIQGKIDFINSIPGALSNLAYMVAYGALDSYPELKRVAQVLCKKQDKVPNQEKGQLRVEIFSFSYKKGYPKDLSGNGGGYMFDCRLMHNPGRYFEYKSLTGRDPEVIDFLENRGESKRFLKNAWGLVDPTVERYLARGFQNLQVGFGCTGGQHRSVYCAEETARHIREVFPEVCVVLKHLEHPN